jgi:hypothetical protein
MVGNHKAGPKPILWIGRLIIACALWLGCLAGLGQTTLSQFDVFLGYDGVIPEASWFPIVCEVKNDGPAFNGVIELGGGDYNQSQTHRLKVELPTGTLKRFIIPVFSNARGYSTWEVRLFDERGKLRGEQTGLRARKQVNVGTPVVGALARTAGGTPSLSAVAPQSLEAQPPTARFQPSIFPDNPLVLEGLNVLYLNSEKASELKDSQISALYAWLHAGGHLVIGVEQIGDITAARWLRNLFPCDLKEMQAVAQHPELQNWVRTGTTKRSSRAGMQLPNTPDRSRPGTRIVSPDQPFSDLLVDPVFEAAPLQVAAGTVRDGTAVLSVGDLPLLVTANRGRGRITALLASPEREPFRSWKNLSAFWALLSEVPGELYTAEARNQSGGWSSDGIFGAMIDSRQVHKLPVEWLLLLLIIYLVVIGPLDQFWLKRIGRPMLTWITFPCYVVLFSLLIYFIGYKLRAGESEWNELNLVDVLSAGEGAELRGRTYASVYSPANQRYLLESQQKFATFRGEFAGSWAGGQSSEKITVFQTGDSFKAEVFVPVWTSQLYVSDWWQPSAVPLSATILPKAGGWEVKVENRTEKRLSNIQLAIETQIITLGEVPPGETKTFAVKRGQGAQVRDFVSRYGNTFQGAVQGRQRTFASSESGHIEDLPNSSVAVSLLSMMNYVNNNYMATFITPPGLDLGPVLDHGNALVFAWAADYSPIKPINQFSPRRLHRDTLWRLAVPINRS